MHNIAKYCIYNLRNFSGGDTPDNWSFREIVTMGTLASQSEIGVWVQAPIAMFRGLNYMRSGVCRIVQRGVGTRSPFPLLPFPSPPLPFPPLEVGPLKSS